MYLLLLIIFLFLQTNTSQSFRSPVVTEEFSSSKPRNKLNVVLFFAGTDKSSNTNYEKNDGMSYLNIPLVAKIKPCTHHPETDFPRSFKSILQPDRSTRECDCKKLLESSVYSLIGWAHNAAGMATAIVSLNNIGKVDVRDNGVLRSPNSVPETIVNAAPVLSAEKLTSTDVISQNLDTNNRENFGQLPLPPDGTMETNDFPKLVNENKPYGRRIPLISAYPHEPKLKFNDIHRYHYKIEPNGYLSPGGLKRHYIVEPENTQYFEINDPATANEDPMKMLEKRSLMDSERPRSFWDVLGAMSMIRQSFFDTLFNPELDPRRRLLDEEDGLDFKSLGQVQPPSLFQIVKRMLRHIQEQTEENNSNGYLLIAFGGQLTDIADPYSDLSQSIKHVLETTDPKCTLTAITGSCSKDLNQNPKLSEIRSSHHVLLPVYAKGPNYKMLSKSQELIDVPKQLKAMIKNHLSTQAVQSREESNNLKSASKIQSHQEAANKQDNDRNKVFEAGKNQQETMWMRRELQSSLSQRNTKNDASDISQELYKYKIVALYLLVCIV